MDSEAGIERVGGGAVIDLVRRLQTPLMETDFWAMVKRAVDVAKLVAQGAGERAGGGGDGPGAGVPVARAAGGGLVVSEGAPESDGGGIAVDDSRYSRQSSRHAAIGAAVIVGCHA